MNRSVVIADSSSLMALANIGEIEVLTKLFTEITVTPEVAREYGHSLPPWIFTRSASFRSTQRPEIGSLDPGEASSIALALDSSNPLLIIDEKKGRRVAEQLNIEIIGTVGVLIKARIAGMIADPTTLLGRLESVDFRLSDTLKSKLAGSEDAFH
jgi:predicted nucleic acid-binding protein